MSTNYYAVLPSCENPCEHCEAPSLLHMNKSLTMFRGRNTSDYGTIRSWADWKRVLIENDLKIMSEYGVTLTVDEFQAQLDLTSVKERRRQFDWIQKNGLASEHDWIDAEGFSFTDHEFF